MSLIEELYNAITSNTTITSALADGAEGVRADLTSYSGRYPVIAYTVVSDVPHMAADDDEIARRVTVQIDILTEDGVDDAIVSEIVKAVTAIGWVRYSTARLTDSDGVRDTAIRFIIAESEE